MSKPQLYSINAWDAANEQSFVFRWEGNQAFGNIIQIKNNTNNEVVYEKPDSTMQLKHTLSANTLKNGILYNVRVAVLDIDNNISEYSEPMLFYCFTTPLFKFNNIAENDIIKNSSYRITMSYEQKENEPLQSWEIGLYDLSKNRIQNSGVRYTNNIEYTTFFIITVMVISK